MSKIEDFIKDMAYMNPAKINRRGLTNIKANAAELYHLIAAGDILITEPGPEPEIVEFDEAEFISDPTKNGFMGGLGGLGGLGDK